ncbi:hypothetical protein LMG7141_03415 [Ralstonia condita]|uniref:Metallo-beta-lactamase domain-containing protein n=2 Tax=Ralstonia condita TaxID=3058600 RepID=A0ABM9JLP7_9RALS|nr:hypothetical protein LMG7141_03415 [Ralstonia sp. LMG 7141]
MVLQMQAALAPLWLPVTLLAFGLGLAFLARCRARLFPVLLAASAVAAGFAWSDWRAEQRLSVALGAAWEGKDIIATGVVVDLPQVAESATRFLFEIESSTAGDAVPPLVRLSWYGARNGRGTDEDDTAPDRRAGIPDLQPGQRWQLTVRLNRPHSLINPEGFDGEYAMLADNIRATGYVRTAKRVKNAQLDEAGSGFWLGVERWRAAVRRRILAALPDARHANVIVALVVGDQSGIATEDWELFRRTGISHLVSISGLHITMIASLFAALWMALWRRSFGMARWLRTPLPLRMPTPRAGAIAATLAAFAYCLLAGMGVPAQRTLLMLSTVAIARLTDRNVPASLSLCWAAAIVAVVDPWAVMSAGFWLSFGAVAIIFLAAQLPLDGGRSPDTPGWPTRLARSLQGATRMQLAITFGLLPLTLLLFQQTSVVSAAANGLAIPLVSFVTTPLALGGAALPDPLAQPLLMWSETSFGCLVSWLEWLARPSWSVWAAPMAPAWALLLAIGGVVLLLLPGAHRAWAWRAQGALLLMPMVLARVPAPLPGEFRVVAFDIGQGAATLVETANHRLLFDTGPRYGDHADAAARAITPYFRAHGVEALDALIVSHEDTDHAGGTETVIEAVPVRTMLASLPEGHALYAVAGAHGIRLTRCQAGQAWSWDGVTFMVLHPVPAPHDGATVTSNARSCVLRVDNGRHAALLTGDIETAQETGLVAGPPERLMADILLVPHHGSKTSSSGAFLDAVSPQVAIFQVGYRNRYGHPHPQVWQRYVARDIERLRTDETGAVVVQTRGDALDVQTARSMRSRYWSSARDVEALATGPEAMGALP